METIKKIYKKHWKLVDSFGNIVAKGFKSVSCAQDCKKLYQLNKKDTLDVIEE